MPNRPIVFAVPLIALLACSSDGTNPTEPGVTVQDVSLPVGGAVYRGADPHVFLGGQVTLFCGRHGVFSNAVAPPQRVGETVVSDYTATFEGELTLEPPVVSSTVTHPLTIQARMAESITLVGDSGGALTLDAELVTFELQGTGMPADVMVRESSARESLGVTTITAVSAGQNRVETYYDVWLDISLDAGRTWHQAEQAVRTTLEPS
jgi:hypothetical protein